MDVGKNTTSRDGHTAEQLVELLIVADGELDEPRDDAGALVLPGSVAGELEDLSRQVLEDRSEVHRGTTADASRVASLAQEPRDTAHRELKPSARRTRLRLGRLAFTTATFTFARHDESELVVGLCCRWARLLLYPRFCDA